jgi:hypothetical protein
MTDEINLAQFGGEIRAELDQTYQFRDSSSGIYTFDPSNPNPKLMEILGKVGMSEKDIAAKLKEYGGGVIGGICLYTGGEFGYDYIILLPSVTAPEGEFALRIGEETIHGEHYTRHRNTGQYTSLFSRIAREFFGGSGQCQIARRVCKIPPGKSLPDGFSVSKASYDQETDTFHFDIPHVVGYELAKESVLGEPSWKRGMFHEPEESRVWALYNDIIVPDIKITIPPALDNRDELLRDVEKYLKSLGLKSNLDLYVDETDTRGINPI